MGTISDSDKNSLGAMEARLLRLFDDLDTPGLDLTTARRLLPEWDADAVQATMRRLADKGRIRRLQRGKYYEIGQDPTRAACHAHAPAYVSFLNRMHDEGYTTQIPRRLDLAYAQVRTRHAEWGSLPITWHPIPSDAFRGYAARPDGVLEATAAKAAADLVHRQKAFGGLTPHRHIVAATLADADDQDLHEAFGAYATSTGTYRRLAYLAASVQRLPDTAQAHLEDLDTHNPIALDLLRTDGTLRNPGRVVVPEGWT